MKMLAPLSRERGAFSAIILNGGKGMRLGGMDKQHISLHGIPAGYYLAHKVSQYANETLIVGSPHTMYANFSSVRQFDDEWRGFGPAGGLCTGLKYMKHEWGLLCAVDMPFFNDSLVAFLLKRAFASRAEIVFFSVDGEAQPFWAIYHKSLLHSLEKFLKQGGSHSLRKFMFSQAYEAIEEGCISPEMLKMAFKNLNTEKDLKFLIDETHSICYSD